MEVLVLQHAAAWVGRVERDGAWGVKRTTHERHIQITLQAMTEDKNSPKLFRPSSWHALLLSAGRCPHQYTARNALPPASPLAERLLYTCR